MDFSVSLLPAKQPTAADCHSTTKNTTLFNCNLKCHKKPQSLKLAIALNAACFLFIVAAPVLILTDWFTMGAMRNIGRDHAGALVKAASGQVSSFFDQAVIQCRNMQVLVHQGTWMLPNDTAATGKVWYADLLAQTITMNRLFNMAYFTNTVLLAADGSWFALNAPTTTNATTYTLAITITAGRAKPSSRINFFTANDSVASIVPPTATTGPDILTQPNWLAYQGLRLNQQVWAEVGFGMGADPSAGTATLESALVNASGTRIAVFGVNFYVDKMRVILESANLTQNTEAFIFDSRNMLVATSHSKNVNKWRGTYNASVSYEPGCYNTSASGVGVVCRYSADLYPFAPLQQLYVQRPQLLNTSTAQTTDGAEIMELDGKTYYVYVAVVASSVPLSMKIVLLMPESDITADVDTGSYIATGVFFAFTYLSGIIVWFLLRFWQKKLKAALSDASSVDSQFIEISELKESLFRSLREDNTLVPQTALNAGDAKEGSATSSEGTSKLEKDLGLPSTHRSQ